MKGRRGRDPVLTGLSIILLILVMAAAALAAARLKKTGERSEREQIEESREEKPENTALAAGQDGEGNSEAAGSGSGQNEPAPRELTDTGSDRAQENGEQQAEERKSGGQGTEEQQEAQREGDQSSKLETLDGVRAGTIVSKEQLYADEMEKYFQAYEIKTTGYTYARINGRSYRDNPNVSLADLRYLKVLHYNFKHEQQVGEIIVNKAIAQDVLAVFRELYDAEYEIQSMRLIDDYWTGDGADSDSASIDKNNTSAFNYRVATGSKKLSNHAYGYAIDINPQQNPYVSYRDGKPRWEHENANSYIDRSAGLSHMITHDDLAYKVFKKYGFKWGGDWNNPKDYQHFEKNREN